MASADTDTFDPNAYEYDARPSEIGATETDIEAAKERIATIRTSDRITFRRCRRRWAWGSHLRGNLGPKQNPAPLWMGTGFHFALEDCHGANTYGHPAEAYRAYKQATIRAARRDLSRLPGDIEELTTLACGMLEYYWDEWLANRPPLETYFHEGVAQTEVNFRVEVPWEKGHFGYDRVVYSGTIDRVVIDEHGMLWIVEYKTAKTIQTLHYSNDSQISTYCWAAELLYGQPVAGVIYQQHRKDTPREPRILANGRLSTNKDQLITHRSLRRVIINTFGSIKNAPQDYVDHLNWLVTTEDMDADKFIRRDKVRRNQHQVESEAAKIMMEIEDMLNPDLPLYPNPDRSCQYMCPFVGPCVSLDDGSDWEEELDLLMQKRDTGYDYWRKYLEVPQQPFTLEHLNNG